MITIKNGTPTPHEWILTQDATSTERFVISDAVDEAAGVFKMKFTTLDGEITHVGDKSLTRVATNTYDVDLTGFDTARAGHYRAEITEYAADAVTVVKRHPFRKGWLRTMIREALDPVNESALLAGYRSLKLLQGIPNVLVVDALFAGGQGLIKWGNLDAALEQARTLTGPVSIFVYRKADGSLIAPALGAATGYVKQAVDDNISIRNPIWEAWAQKVTTFADLKVFLQGPYSGGTMSTGLDTGNVLPQAQPYLNGNYAYTHKHCYTPSYIQPRNNRWPQIDFCDWVVVEVRAEPPAAASLGRFPKILLANGSIANTDGSTPVRFRGLPPGSYYWAIHQRNHLSVMSSVKHPATIDPLAATQYDLTANAAKSYGAGGVQDLGGGVFGMIAGDTNANGVVGPDDHDLFAVQSGVGEGYWLVDVNFDRVVNNTDKNSFMIPNYGKQTRVPL